MKYRFFRIPVMGDIQAEESRLNRTLAENPVVRVESEFVNNGEDSAWCLTVICTEQTPDKQPAREGQVDYKAVLSEEDFAIYARLRALRKELAAQEGKPIWTVFTNQQLAQMVTEKVRSIEEIRALKGVGPQRAAKFGSTFLDSLTQVQGGSEEHA